MLLYHLQPARIRLQETVRQRFAWVVHSPQVFLELAMALNRAVLRYIVPSVTVENRYVQIIRLILDDERVLYGIVRRMECGANGRRSGANVSLA